MAQVTQTRIKVENPNLDGEIRAYMSADSAAAATSISTLDNTGFVQTGSTDYYILIGEYGTEKSEIVLVDASDAGTDENSFKVSALKYAHSASDPVTYMRWNKINIYGATATGGTKVEIPTDSPVDIDISQTFTEYTYTGTTYSFFYSAFYSATLNSFGPYSDEITASDATERKSFKRIIDAGARKALTTIDQNNNSVLNWDVAIEILQDGSDEILARKRRWGFLRAIDTSISTVTEQQYIELPSDCALLEFVIIDCESLKAVSRVDYNDYTLSGTPTTTGAPISFTMKNDKVYLYPTPNSAYTVTYEYYKVPAAVTTDLSTTVSRPFVPILMYYCAAHFAYIRGNDKRGDKMYKQFEKLLEDQVIEYSGPDQIGQAEYVERTSAYNEDTMSDSFYLNNQ